MQISTTKQMLWT